VHRSRAMQKMKAGSLPELGRMADKLKLICYFEQEPGRGAAANPLTKDERGPGPDMSIRRTCPCRQVGKEDFATQYCRLGAGAPSPLKSQEAWSPALAESRIITLGGLVPR